MQRPLARETLHLPSQLTDKDFEYMRLKAKHHFDEIMAVLRNMPQALLLIIRYVPVSLLFQSSVQNLVGKIFDQLLLRLQWNLLNCDPYCRNLRTKIIFLKHPAVITKENCFILIIPLLGFHYEVVIYTAL